MLSYEGEAIISIFLSAVALIGYNLLEPVVGNPFGFTVSCKFGETLVKSLLVLPLR